MVSVVFLLALYIVVSVLCNCLAWASIVYVMSRSYPYPHPQQPAPLHLVVNSIDCEKYLRNSGG